MFSIEAQLDLAEIRAYIGRDSPAAANRIAVQPMAACDRLEYLPERGRPGREPGTRELTVLWPYIIVYEVKLGHVDILSIRHGARDR